MYPELPATQFYILLAITFTGVSIAVTIQRGLKAIERRNSTTKRMLCIGCVTLLVSWLSVAGLVLRTLVETFLLHSWADFLYLLTHFVVLTLVGLFALWLIQALSQPGGTQQGPAQSNVLLN